LNRPSSISYRYCSASRNNKQGLIKQDLLLINGKSYAGYRHRSLADGAGCVSRDRVSNKPAFALDAGSYSNPARVASWPPQATVTACNRNYHYARPSQCTEGRECRREREGASRCLRAGLSHGKSSAGDGHGASARASTGVACDGIIDSTVA
jgi:hypothetical protein